MFLFLKPLSLLSVLFLLDKSLPFELLRLLFDNPFLLLGDPLLLPQFDLFSFKALFLSLCLFFKLTQLGKLAFLSHGFVVAFVLLEDLGEVLLKRSGLVDGVD